jgi:hypothetical protein
MSGVWPAAPINQSHVVRRVCGGGAVTERPKDRAAAHEVKAQRIRELRIEARQIVRAAHEAADALNPAGVVAAGRSLRSILWRLAGLGVALQPEDLATADMVSDEGRVRWP